MGKHGPKRGSRAFRPRGRAVSLVPRMRAWPAVEKGLVGFAGYKVGMAHALVVAGEGPWKGQEVATPITIVETPPIFVYGVRAYEQTPYGLRIACEVQIPLPKHVALSRVTTPAKKAGDFSKLDVVAERVKEVRVLACTQPSKAGVGKKKPEVFELALGGDPRAQVEFAKSVLGKEIHVGEVFSSGDYVDVTTVTKGKGWQGVVKRFGVSLNPRKATKVRRHGGSLGGETQATVMYTVPRPGQTGFHRRTEVNKRILALGMKPMELAPKGGWPHYGEMKGDFLVIEGSLPGPAKRFLRIRKAMEGEEPKKAEPKAIIISKTRVPFAG